MKKIILLTIFLLLSFNSIAQTPIEFVVSASPGGPNDIVTRLVADKLSRNTSLKFIVLNKPGAAHTIGYNYVLNSDKPTLLMSTSEITKHDVYGHLEELHTAGYFTNILFVSEKSGIRNINQLIEISKKREITFGHGGINTFSHSAMESICSTLLKCLPVSYKSAAEGMLGLMSNQIDAYAIASYGSKQFLENNKVTPIYEIKVSDNKGWFKLFAKNLSEKDKSAIVSVLKSQDTKFFDDMGFKK